MTVFPWKKGGVSGPPMRFEAGEEGRKNLIEFLVAKPKVPLYMLVDLVEEEFRNEIQPHVFGTDHQSLVERRLARAFPTTSFRKLFVQGREKKQGRRDDLTLLAGVTEPDLIAPWVEAIRENRLLLAGIHSLPMVSTRLLKILGVESPATLMVSWQSTSGLRFSFYSGRHLKMSRMAKVPGSNPESYAKLFMAELERTKSYLSSLRLNPVDVPVKVVLFTSPEMLDAVRPMCQESATIKFELMTVNVVARKLGIKRRITTPYSDSLFIQMLGQRSPANHYASPDMTSAYHSWLLRNTLNAASVVLFATIFLAGGGGMWSGYGKWVQVKEREREAKALYAQYRGVIDQHLPTNIEPADVRLAVQTIERIQELGGGPAEVMVDLSQQLEGYPHFRVDSMKWYGPLHAASQEMLGGTSPGMRTPELRPRAMVGQDTPSKTMLKPTDVLEIVEFKGEVEKINNDVGHALEQVNQFMAGFLLDPEVYRVDPVEVPKVKEKVAVLEGDLTRIKKEVVNSAPFAFKIVYRRIRGAGQN
ncbi:MAG: hypothetical protein HQL74_13605 [Magnetococcales bacterium]|nr:hypothetical protein [Magnetococcales bacterium]